MFKNRSKLLFTIIILESILSVWALFYFNYQDRLNYNSAIVKSTTDLALLIENMYTSTWWALIILSLCLISIFSIVCFIYKDLKFQFIALCLWIILLLLALNIKDSFLNNISTLAIFAPIFVVNVLGYINQRKLIKKKV